MDAAVIPAHQQLKQAREKATWSLERVALTLNLAQTVLQHLEAGDYDKLPKGPYVSGYIRAYAGLFDLDAEALVAQYYSEIELPTIDDFREPEMHNAKLSPGFQHKKYRTAYGVAAALLLIMGLAVYSVLQAEPMQQTHAWQQHETQMLQKVIPVAAAEPSGSETSHEVADTASAQVKMMPEQQIDEARNVSSSAAPADLLALRFSGDCWVEIKDADGELIVSSVKKANDSLELTGDAPFHITLGYAPAVALSYNGEPVDIKAGRGNIVRLVVGNS